MRDRVVVPLHNFVDPSRQKDQARFEAFNDGYGDMVVRKQIIKANLDVMPSGEGLLVTATNNGHGDSDLAGFMDAPRVTVLEGTCEGLGLPANWRGYDTARIAVTNGDKPLTIECIIVGTRSRIIERRDLAPGERAEYVIDLRDVPLLQGKHPPYEPNGIRIAVLWDGDNEPRSFTLHSITMEPLLDDKPRPCVDRYGRRLLGSWEGKVSSDEELRESIDREKRQLAALAPPADRSKFGGWTAGPRREATGFFRVLQDNDGRWWYIDPEGYQFWSVGSTGIRFSDNTDPAGREEVFEELPPRSGPYAGAWDDSGCISFHRWNLLRKWGTLEAWRDHVLERLVKWGYNTVANWSAGPLMLDQQRVAHVRTLNTKGPQEVCCGKSFYDVFDPRWEEWFVRECARGAAPHKDNPWVIGYFVDNEKPWRTMGLLNAGADCAIREQWLSLVKERYDSPRAFSDAAGCACATWDDVRALTDGQLPGEGTAQTLREELENRYTERYFTEIRRILKAADPNHLYMGCRYVQSPPRDEIIRIAGRHVDVMSVNCYSLVPPRQRFQHWYDLSGKPIQVGEHQMALFGVRQHPPTWTAFTQEDRREWYPKYDGTLAGMPFGIGSHWFQWVDQCITGRPSNGENQMIGVVDITDQPHPEMVEAIREIGANVYAWHSQSR